MIFGFFSIYFSFGNIENAKTLQIVTTILRFVVTILMCIGSIYYIEEKGVHEAPVFNIGEQIKYLA
jgi:TRAP-type C4-dicarboxylate transport system permease small subunit